MEVSRGLGVRERKGKAEGDHNIGATDQKKVFWLFWVGNHGGSFFLHLEESGHRKGVEIDEGAEMPGKSEGPWETILLLSCLIPPVAWLCPEFSKQTHCHVITPSIHIFFFPLYIPADCGTIQMLMAAS